jgi:hypothetical protein
MSLELGLEYKRRAQAKMYERCQGDMEKLLQLCEETVVKLEREGGFKFKRGVPAGWTPPEIEWSDSKETEMVLHESIDSKYAAQAKHYEQTGGEPVSYAKLLRKTHKTAIKRRSAKNKAAGAK